MLFLALLPAVLAQLTPSPKYMPPLPTAGNIPSTSKPNKQWSNVMGNAFYFYDEQRSGNIHLGTYGNRVPWRNNTCLGDGSDVGLDLTGGWMDAGDYIKCEPSNTVLIGGTFPLGFTMFNQAWGPLAYGAGFDMAKQTGYLDAILRWGFDWLLKVHPSANDHTLYVQVGDTDIDNNYWGGDQNVPLPRPSYPINDSYIGTDAWASTSAAFAMGSMLYTPGFTHNYTSTSLPPSSPCLADASYASTLLAHAKGLYSTAKSLKPYQLYSISVPAMQEAYPSTCFADDLTLAALTLALATGDSKYYADAYKFYTTYGLSGSQSVYNWDHRFPAVFVLFAEISKSRPQLAKGAGLDRNVTGWQNQAELYFDRILDHKTVNGTFTPAGLLYFYPESPYDSMQIATAIAMLFFKYAPIASTPAKTARYNAFAQSQVDYMLGKNPMNVPYVVGQHPNSPKNPQSAPASGGTNISNVRNSPPVEAHVWYGALVGGPLANDKFWDWRDDWVQTESALDYVSVVPTLAAMQLMNGSGDPFYVGMKGTYHLPKGQPCDIALPCDGSS